MRLSEVTIRNFCSCHHLVVPLTDFNPIVGYNNSGKSNILRAISWMLKKSVLPSHMFFDPSVQVTVEGIIESVNLMLLPANQKQSVSAYINNGALKFRRRQDEPGCPAGQIKIDVFDYKTNAWVDNPTGLDTAISVLFPEPLYIEAMEDAGEDVGKFGAKNTIGLLLKHVLGVITKNNAAAINAMQTALTNVSNHLNGKSRMAELHTFESDATKAISSFFPGLSLHLNFAPPDIDTLFKSSTISLSDVQGSPRPFTSFGHGAQRSTHMALIKLLADLTFGRAGSQNGIVVLLIDEPELYLHPQAIELLRDSLLQLSGQNFQIIFSTHSPLLIGRAHALQTLMVYKNPANKTVARQKLQSAAQSFSTHTHHAEAIFSIQSATHLLFSEEVLLVEGKTEQMLLPQIYHSVRKKSFASDKGCIVSGMSSSALIPMMDILRSVGFKPKAVADLDFIFKIAPGANLINNTEASYVNCLNWFATNATHHKFYLDASGLPTKKGPGGAVSALNAAEAFELMAKAMSSDVQVLVQILHNKDIWIWPKGAIEAHLGIKKNDTARVDFIDKAVKNGNLAHATDANALVSLANWMAKVTVRYRQTNKCVPVRINRVR